MRKVDIRICSVTQERINAENFEIEFEPEKFAELSLNERTEPADCVTEIHLFLSPERFLSVFQKKSRKVRERHGIVKEY